MDNNQASTRDGLGHTAGEIRSAMLWIAGQLRHLGARIGALCTTVPAPGDRFEVPGHLCGILDCVHRDLIQDAILTLERAAHRDETQLRRDFDRMQLLLADPRRIA